MEWVGKEKVGRLLVRGEYVEALYYGNQYFLFLYREYADVRLVGAPPSSIGKFSDLPIDTIMIGIARDTTEYMVKAENAA